jgi:hypothetical protein
MERAGCDLCQHGSSSFQNLEMYVTTSVHARHHVVGKHGPKKTLSVLNGDHEDVYNFIKGPASRSIRLTFIFGAAFVALRFLFPLR